MALLTRHSTVIGYDSDEGGNKKKLRKRATGVNVYRPVESYRSIFAGS